MGPYKSELTEQELIDRVEHVANWYFKGKTFGFRFRSNIVKAEFKVGQAVGSRYYPGADSAIILYGTMRVFVPKGAQVGEIQKLKDYTLIPIQLEDGTSSTVRVDDESLLHYLPSLGEIVREYRGFHPDTESYAHKMKVAISVQVYKIIKSK